MAQLDSISVNIIDGIATLSVDRAAALNALNSTVLGSLETALGELHALCRGEHAYDRVRAVILTGAGDKAFVAGADIKEMQNASPRKLGEFTELGQRVMRQIEELPLPVIAAVNGYAIGGGLELALACDLIAASDRAKLGLAEVGLGLLPGFGGTQRLAFRAGIGVAKRLIFSGDPVSAEEALRLGIVEWVFPHAALIDRVTAIAKGIALKGPLGIAAAKRAIHAGFAVHAREGLAAEVLEFVRNASTADAAEGMQAFGEKRAPNFRGR